MPDKRHRRGLRITIDATYIYIQNTLMFCVGFGSRCTQFIKDMTVMFGSSDPNWQSGFCSFPTRPQVPASPGAWCIAGDTISAVWIFRDLTLMGVSTNAGAPK